MAPIELAVEFHRDSLAVVLHQQPEMLCVDGGADLAMRRAAVLDDVADRLAQDPGGLHEHARGELLFKFVHRVAPVGFDVGLTQTRHGLGAPVGQRVGQPHRLAGQPAHRQAHLLQGLARQRGDAFALARVHDGQQLGPEVVVQVGGDAFALLLGHLLDAQRRQLREVALDLRGGFLHALLQQRAIDFCRLQRAPEHLQQPRSDAQQQQWKREVQGLHGQPGQPAVLHRDFVHHEQAHAAQRDSHRPEIVAMVLPRKPQVDRDGCDQFGCHQHEPGAGRREEVVCTDRGEADRHQHALQQQCDRDRARSHSGIAQQELHRHRHHGRKCAAHDDLERVRLPGPLRPPHAQRQHGPSDQQPPEVHEEDLAAVDPAQDQQETPERDQRDADDLDGPDAPELALFVQRLHLGCGPDPQHRQPACARASRDMSQRRAAYLDVEHVQRLIEQNRRQVDQLRAMAVARRRLGHAPAAEDSSAVQVHFEVAAGALDVERQQVVGRQTGRPDEAGPVPHAAVVVGARCGPVIGQPNWRGRPLGREVRLVAVDRERRMDRQRFGVGRTADQPRPEGEDQEQGTGRHGRRLCRMLSGVETPAPGALQVPRHNRRTPAQIGRT